MVLGTIYHEAIRRFQRKPQKRGLKVRWWCWRTESTWMFQRKPQKRGLKANDLLKLNNPWKMVSKKTSKKRIEREYQNLISRLCTSSVSKKTSKKRIERQVYVFAGVTMGWPRFKENLKKEDWKVTIVTYCNFVAVGLFQRKPQKRGLKAQFTKLCLRVCKSSFQRKPQKRGLKVSTQSIFITWFFPVSKKTLKKRIET